MDSKTEEDIVKALLDPRKTNNIFRSWYGRIYLYNNGKYRELLTHAINYEIAECIRTLGRIHNTERLSKSIIFALSTHPTAYISDLISINSWLDNSHLLQHGIEPTNILSTTALENGLLIITKDTLEAALIPHSSLYFTVSKLPYNYDPDAKTPLWDKFLNDVMDGDTERIQLLQQWAGYLLKPCLNEQCFLFCSGEGGTGKGTFFNTIQHLVGDENCTHILLRNFHKDFALYSTLGKIVNMCRESEQTINVAAENLLKTYTGDEYMTFQRKFKDDIHMRPTAKQMISCNVRPDFSDPTDALWRRMLYVNFDHKFRNGERDKNMEIKLYTQLSGILNWALDGLRSLTQTGLFIKPKISELQKTEYRLDLHPTRRFLQENYRQAPYSKTVALDDIFTEYQQWLIDAGQIDETDKAKFGQSIRHTFPKAIKERPYNPITEKRQTIYHGIRHT